jgi:hypothetical protein
MQLELEIAHLPAIWVWVKNQHHYITYKHLGFSGKTPLQIDWAFFWPIVWQIYIYETRVAQIAVQKHAVNRERNDAILQINFAMHMDM